MWGANQSGGGCGGDNDCGGGHQADSMPANQCNVSATNLVSLRVFRIKALLVDEDKERHVCYYSIKRISRELCGQIIHAAFYRRPQVGRARRRQREQARLQKGPILDRMFASTSQRNDDGLRASYNISLLIAKSGKPHTIGEKLILPAVEEVLKTVLHKPASDIIKRIPLSNNTVERRIDEMSSDIESFLCNYLQTTHFSIQLDESILPDNAALLLAYVRFIMNQEIYEELLFARTLITDTKGEPIFHVLKDYFIEKAIPLSNIISVATDGAPAMVGRYRGFISSLKQNVSGVLAIHCVIHRQHLVAKNLSVRLHESLHLVIDAVNRIRSNALNTRLFAQLCEENDEHFHQLLLHTEVRWLSKGLCLTRFFALFETILEFLDTKAFLARVKLMKQNIGRGEISQFPNLSQTSCQEDDVSTYVQHLNALYSDFESRFEDILTMVIPPWIINPYGDIEETNVIIQEELTELSTNKELKVQFKNGYQQFWLQNNIPVTYPVLWNIARKCLISFPSSYLVERGFSAVTNLLTKKRNRLYIISRDKGDQRTNKLDKRCSSRANSCSDSTQVFQIVCQSRY
ncbi:unnamed protein product [Acanthoscelides obtectus]|uniref:SCAN domain-containing protein 3 n=1 Tax=Acanthoscelides obtectus TaxID=200917 RepID=A0A9P0P3D9_ACAOB|nr:unnamed protein product [Acanthoscelides obtectus]CAK1633804.1 SCAN domain-containing protein 3 [Acanthoscelides obtectus]